MLHTVLVAFLLCFFHFAADTFKIAFDISPATSPADEMTEHEPLSVLRAIASDLPGKLVSASSVSELQLMDGYLVTALIAVRARLNQISPTNRFPAEVLAAIFDCVRLPRSCEDTEAEVPTDSRPLIAVTHVCRRWRTIALGYASLWTGIATYSGSRRAFVERSRGAPQVDVSAAVINGQLSRAQKRLLSTLRPRIQRLSLKVASHAQLTVFRKALRELSGTLEVLVIVVDQSFPAYPAGGPPGNYPTSTISLFGGQVPALRSLSISSKRALIPTDHFPALVDLHLTRFLRGDFLTHLPQLLRNTPALQTFHLHLHQHIQAVWLGSFEAREESISLIDMRRFCITSAPCMGNRREPNNLGFCGIPSKLLLPRGAIVSVQWNEEHPTKKSFPPMFVPSTGPHLQSTLTVHDRGTEVITRGHSTHIIRYGERIDAFAIHPGHLRSTFAVGDSLVKLRAVLRTVHVLRLQGSFSWSLIDHRQEALCTLTGHTPFLRHLVIRDIEREMISQLVRLLEIPDHAVLCPQLESVVIITVSSRQYRVPTSDFLFRATTRRAAQGYPLKYLAICSPYHDREYTLENAHGVERIAVLRRDLWSDSVYDRVDSDVADHWRAVEPGSMSSGQRTTGGTAKGYEDLWKSHVEGKPPARRFGAWGHRRRCW